MLEVRNVSKVFENQRGVQHMDFTMQRGEIVGFLGPNGAGKTTTMRMITGYLLPTKGIISLDGHIMAEHPREAKRKIGYLPETPPLYMEMTVHSYLKWIADLRDIPIRETKKRISDVMDRLGLIGRENQIIRSLSKGYKQRIGLAQAIVHNPDLLILDEPTSGLDPKQITEIRDLIRELGERHTVLLSTHILQEVNSLCTRVMIVNQGRLVLDENTDQIGHRMNGGNVQVELVPNCERTKAEEILNGIEDISKIVWDGESNRCTVTSSKSNENGINLNQSNSLNEQIFFAFAKADVAVHELKTRLMSLEEIFLKLTSGGM